ncbi:uncharacterized protein LOC124531285 [Vanessa cardui]|uniref:uncharacterized protein LOC124531285 n=1 Tax=Vanessa cardui TaxID=171605 RepID=UPI001F13965B|nr:uncharacterized protein LOC124531285 [Vanessa cardui]
MSIYVVGRAQYLPAVATVATVAHTTPGMDAAQLSKKLKFLGAWRLLALLAVFPAALSDNLPYTTIAEKSIAGYRVKETSSFTIPNYQCSGFIDESLLCGLGGVAGAVRVMVKEGSSFPTVRINRHLRNVTILRSQDAWGVCAGQAAVEVYVGCLVVAPQKRPRRQRRSVASLPAASTERTLLE